MFKKVLSKVLDVFIIFACLFGMVMLLVIVYFVTPDIAWRVYFASEFRSKMFNAALLMAIISGIMHFYQFFVRGFGETFRHLVSK